MPSDRRRPLRRSWGGHVGRWVRCVLHEVTRSPMQSRRHALPWVLVVVLSGCDAAAEDGTPGYPTPTSAGAGGGC